MSFIIALLSLPLCQPSPSKSIRRHISSLLRHTARRILPDGRNTASELESAMNQVEVEQKSYQMPPLDGFTIAHFLTVTDIERSARFYEKVFGGRILSRGDSSGAVHPDREYAAHSQLWRRPDTRQAVGNAQRARGARFSSSRSRRTSTARRAATFAIRTATS